jgi:cellobiose phosphorylase
MMTQAWNLYSFAVPIVRQFFGIQPRAFEKTIRIQPQIPTSWQEASLENVLVGDNELSIQFEVKNGQRQITLSQTKPDWKMHLAFPKGKYTQWELDGKPVKPAVEGDFEVLELTGSKMVVRVK